MTPTGALLHAKSHRSRFLTDLKDSFCFGNALGTSVNVRMPIWNDLFGPRSFQMRTAVSHHAIRAIRGVVPTTIADDRVVGDGGCDRKAVHGHDASRLGAKGINAIGKARDNLFSIARCGLFD